MPTLRGSTFLLLLLIVASRVRGNDTATVTLFRAAISEKMTSASAIGLGASGGTAYVEQLAVTGELELPNSTTTVTDTFGVTVTQAASWLYQAEPAPSGDFNALETNCTLKTQECIEISRELNGTSIKATTITYTGHILPLYTLTVTDSNIVMPTSTTSAATTPGNPLFNRLNMILFVVILIFGHERIV